MWWGKIVAKRGKVRMCERSIALTAMLIHVTTCLFSLKFRCTVDYPLHHCSVCTCTCVCVWGCVTGIERAVCIAVYSIHYSGATDKLLPGQTLIFTQWISLLANLIAWWVMGRCYEWAPMGKRRTESKERKGREKGREMSEERQKWRKTCE